MFKQVKSLNSIHNSIVSGRVFTLPKELLWHHQCVKRIRIWSYSGPYFSVFRLNATQKSVNVKLRCSTHVYKI